jgi:hypothetical protein
MRAVRQQALGLLGGVAFNAVLLLAYLAGQWRRS